MTTEIENLSDIMVDLETLGIEPGCVVPCVGLVKFDPWGTKKNSSNPIQSTETLKQQSLRIDLDIQEQLKLGLKIDGGTLEWWMLQSENARKSVFDPNRNTYSLSRGLEEISDFFHKSSFIWGNGAGFDIPILKALYSAADKTPPWDFWNERCYRTLKTLNNYDKNLIPKNEIPHDPIYDAINQVQTVQAIIFHNPKLNI